jgi:hypothetical protein
MAMDGCCNGLSSNAWRQPADGARSNVDCGAQSDAFACTPKRDDVHVCVRDRSSARHQSKPRVLRRSSPLFRALCPSLSTETCGLIGHLASGHRRVLNPRCSPTVGPAGEHTVLVWVPVVRRRFPVGLSSVGLRAIGLSRVGLRAIGWIGLSLVGVRANGLDLLGDVNVDHLWAEFPHGRGVGAWRRRHARSARSLDW